MSHHVRGPSWSMSKTPAPPSVAVAVTASACPPHPPPTSFCRLTTFWPGLNWLIIFYAKWAICCRYKAHSVHFHCYYCAAFMLSLLAIPLPLPHAPTPYYTLYSVVCTLYSAVSCMHINFDAGQTQRPNCKFTCNAALGNRRTRL